MNQGQGKQTGLFGEWLSNYLKNKPQHYVVYYDHGDRYKNPNVVSIKSFYGDKLSNQNQLAEVDVMVTKPNHDIVAIVEIEERESPPKKIIGDIIALLMCNHFSVRLNGKNQYFRITSGTKLIVAGFINPKGSKMAQLKEVILPRILQFTPLLEGINPKNLSIICEEDLETTMVKLREYMQGLFS
jgi:hypothetical protein